MNKMKKAGSLIVALLLLVTFVFSGCGSSGSGTDTGSTTKLETTASTAGETTTEMTVKWDTTKKKKIIFATINNYYTTALKQVAKDYTALHPETEVVLDIMDGGAYQQAFTTKITGDKSTAPDIIHTNCAAPNDGEAMAKGWFMPMDELVDSPNPYNSNEKIRDTVDSEWWAFATCSEGKIAYLPFDLVGVGVFYNKGVFEKLGIEPPKTYDEYYALCDKIKQSGFDAPIAATGTADWMLIGLADWAYRKYLPEIVSAPGDARYDENTMKANTALENFDPNDPTYGSNAIVDPEKYIKFVKSFNRKSEVSKRIWATYIKLTQYFQKGWPALNDDQAYAQFMAQKAPMYITGSWMVGKILGDMKKLSDDKKFSWGTFSFPGLTEPGEDFQGIQRGLLVPGHRLGIANKGDDDLYYRSADFLQYMYSPEIAAQIYDTTVKAGEYIQGPSLIKGVELSNEVISYLEGFKVAGNMRFDFFNFEFDHLANDGATMNDAKAKFSQGKITWEEFSDIKEKVMQKKFADTIKQNNYDLDPKTKDAAN